MEHFLENHAYYNVWNPGVLSTGTSHLGTGNNSHKYGKVNNLVMWTLANTGGVTCTMEYWTSLDGVTYTKLVNSEDWVPAAGDWNYGRIHVDRLPEATRFGQWRLKLVGGTSIAQMAMEIAEQLYEAPSKGTSTPLGVGGVGVTGVGHHFNGSGSGRLEQDANGKDRLRLDLVP